MIANDEAEFLVAMADPSVDEIRLVPFRVYSFAETVPVTRRIMIVARGAVIEFEEGFGWATAPLPAGLDRTGALIVDAGKPADLAATRADRLARAAADTQTVSDRASRRRGPG